jgi:lysophospholipase L1-like esterase
VLGELAARLYVFGWSAFDREALRTYVVAGRAGLFQASPDPGLLFEWRPGLDVRHRLVSFRANARGMRDTDEPQPGAPGLFRVAAIGDSFTAGEGLEAADVWPQVLEDRWRSRARGRPVEVWNFGVSAYHLDQYVATLERKVLPLRPDLVVVGYCAVNDNEPRPPEWRAPYVPPQRRDGFTACYLHKLLKTWIRLSTRICPRSIELTEESRAFVAGQLGRIAELGHAAGVPVVVAYLSSYELDPEPVRRLAEEAGLSFVDASRGLRYADLPRHRVGPLDYHANARAQLHFADRIEAALGALGLLPEPLAGPAPLRSSPTPPLR